MRLRILLVLLSALLWASSASTVHAGNNVWTSLGPGGGIVFALAIDPTTPTTLYAGTRHGVFKSTNGESSWSAINTGLSDFNGVTALAIDPTTPTTLYAGTYDGVFQSTDGGSSWSAVLTNTTVRALAIDPFTPSTLYAGTDGSGVFRSANGGSSWSAVNTGLTHTFVIALAIDPITPNTLYAGTEFGSVFAITFITSSCAWGLYIDDHQSGGSWEARLFLSNIDMQHAHDYEVFVLATDAVRRTSLRLGPSGIVQLTCSNVQACGTAGWLYVQSDAPVFAATLFMINNTIGGGSLTAQTPNCQFGVH